MTANPDTTVIATYRVQAAHEDAFVKLLEEHHPTLVRLGLATGERPVIYRGQEAGEPGPTYFEIFTWSSPEAPDTAHHTPEVMRVWEAIGELVEERDGRPKFEFPHVRRVDLAFADA